MVSIKLVFGSWYFPFYCAKLMLYRFLIHALLNPSYSKTSELNILSSLTTAFQADSHLKWRDDITDAG